MINLRYKQHINKILWKKMQVCDINTLVKYQRKTYFSNQNTRALRCFSDKDTSNPSSDEILIRVETFVGFKLVVCISA